MKWYSKLDDWAELDPDEIPFNMVASRRNDCNKYVFGYFNHSRLDGTIRVDSIDDYYEISFFFINPAVQNQGAGQQLFRHILNRFTDKKLILYVYTDNERALHIYKKYGFRIIGKGKRMDYRPNDEHYVMWRLAAVSAKPKRKSFRSLFLQGQRLYTVV